jgi:hypothetical protein
MVASNTAAEETRWPALRAAGLGEVVQVALLSAALGVAKPDPLFYQLVLSAAGCAPGDVVFVGDNPDHDVHGPLRHGMRAVLIRPAGRSDEDLVPDGVPVIPRFSALPGALREIRDRAAGSDGFHVAGHEGVTLDCPLRCVGLETVRDLIRVVPASVNTLGTRPMALSDGAGRGPQGVGPGSPLACLGLSERVRSAFRQHRSKARTVGDVLALVQSGELKNIHNIGPRSVREVQTALVAAGYSLEEHPYLKF